MEKRDAIKLEALHINGEAIEWWFHGMKTLVHDQLFTYGEFGQRLTERFDQRYIDIYFHDLAHIRQVGNPKSYI